MFARVITSKGKKYLNIINGYRDDNGKVKQQVIANLGRIDELNKAYDRTLELNETQLKEAIDNGIKFTVKADDIKDCNIYIVTVPTPIDKK